VFLDLDSAISLASDIDEHAHKNMTQPPPTTSNKSHTKASLCARLLWENYALSGPTPMTTCQTFLPRVS